MPKLKVKKTQKAIDARMEIRRQKRIKKPIITEKNKKISHAMPFLKNIVSGINVDMTCCDFKVGSTQVLDVLTGNFSLEKTHKRYATDKEKRMIGELGENAFRTFLSEHPNEGKIKKYQPLRELSYLKFVVARPDFLILRNGEYMLTEIKTSTKGITTHTISLKDKLQIWVSMDVFHVKKCLLVFYHYNERDNLITRKASFVFTKKEVFFDKKILELFLSNYCVFLRSFFLMNNNSLSKDDLSKFSQLASQSFESRVKES